MYGSVTLGAERMTVVIDRDIVGSGSDSMPLGQNRFIVAVLTIDVVGPDVRPLEMADPDHLLRLGWLALGVLYTPLDGIEREFWNPPQWINFVNSRFGPSPGAMGTLFAVDFVGLVRWSLSYGTQGHLTVEAE